MTDSRRLTLAFGTLGAALILGAYGFQYIGHYPPCELCWWQRYPHMAAAVIGLIGGLLVKPGSRPLAALVILLVAISGGIGVYHAGVEWHLWKGPSTCTGGPFLGDIHDLNAPVVMCDHAAWRMFGISMAGYNALISLGAALFGAVALTKAKS